MAAAENNNQDVQFVLTQIYGLEVNKKFPLNGPVVLIGRAPNADVKVDGVNVSRKHCILKKQPEGWTLQDCGSQSGTYVNGQLLQRNETLRLQFGDVIFLGPPSDFPTGFCFETIADETEQKWVKAQPQDDLLLACAVQCSIDSQSQSTAVFQGSQVDCYKIMFNKDADCVPTTFRQMHNVASSSRNDEFNNKQKFSKVLKPNNTSAVTSNFTLQSSEHRECDRCSKCTVNNQEVVEDLKSKLAVLSEKIKKLEKYQSDLLKENADSCEKSKLLDQQLIEQNKVIEDMLVNEQTMKTEFKNKVIGQLEEDLICNICSELLIKPTVLDCSHTFCEYCIKQWEKEKRQCPVCRKNIQSETRVLALDNFIDKTLEALTPQQKKMRQQLRLDREKKIPNSTPPEKRRRIEHAPRLPVQSSVNDITLQPVFLGSYMNNPTPLFPGSSNVGFPQSWNYPPFSGFF